MYERRRFVDALRTIERGDLTPAQLIGAWAGEISQTQFLPSACISLQLISKASDVVT